MRARRPQFLATRSSRRHRACSMRTREDHSAIRGTLSRMTAVGQLGGRFRQPNLTRERRYRVLVSAQDRERRMCATSIGRLLLYADSGRQECANSGRSPTACRLGDCCGHLNSGRLLPILVLFCTVPEGPPWREPGRSRQFFSLGSLGTCTGEGEPRVDPTLSIRCESSCPTVGGCLRGMSPPVDWRNDHPPQALALLFKKRCGA